MVWRAMSKPAFHEAESAFVTGEGGASRNGMKISKICAPPSPPGPVGPRAAPLFPPNPTGHGAALQ